MPYRAQTNDDQWWASDDGQHWLPVNARPEPGDGPAIAALFAPDPEGGRAVTFARRWLQLHGAATYAALAD